MTRNDFLENITTFGDLKDFCDNEGCTLLDDVYDEASRDNYIDDHLVDWAREGCWRDLYNTLEVIPEGYDWYRHGVYEDWCGLDDNEDFEEYKNDVLYWADDNCIWDEDEEENEENVDSIDGEDNDPAPEEDFSVGDLIGMCVVALDVIQSEDYRRAREEELCRLYPKVLK